MGRKRLTVLVVSFFFFCWFAVLPAQAQEPAVVVKPDHPDWTYREGQKALFSIAVQRDGKAMKNSRVHIEIGPEKMPPTIVCDTVLKKGQLAIGGGTLSKPGFLRCAVTTVIDSKSYKGMATAAFSPGSIAATAERPQDFAAYWTTVIRDARKISLSPRMTLLPDRSAGALNVYEVSFQNFRGGSRMYGVLCVPKKEGRYPAVLKVPGAGVRAYRGDTALAENGVVTFEIGIHGIPVTLPNEVYYNLAAGALYEYYF
ncbi:MAG TPA: acetylxylan esterase, partial [Flavisolibacter sp.]|nr:acetylxylan esterase [Flavisolibacter sp.]